MRIVLALLLLTGTALAEDQHLATYACRDEDRRICSQACSGAQIGICNGQPELGEPCVCLEPLGRAPAAVAGSELPSADIPLSVCFGPKCGQ